MRTLGQQRAVRHPVFARVYARVGHLMDAEIGDHRRWLLAGPTGRVLEVGAGNGLNFPHYPVAVTEVLAIEPEPYLRHLAQAAARQAPVPIRVVDGTAEALPAPDDATFDAVVASLVLCTVADPDQALAEVRRVLRPSGRLRFYEHVRATDPRLARWQDRLERPWGWLVGGCHPNRDTVAAIAAGLRLVQLDRFDLPAMPPLARPHVLGVRSAGSSTSGKEKGGTMQATETKGPQLARPGPIGLGIRVLLGATILYWFAALLTKWTGLLERDPIESGRLYTLLTIWLLPEVFALTLRRPWGLWPALVFVAGGAAIGLAGSLTGHGVWNPVLAGWTYAGDLLVWGALAVSFPFAIVTRSPGCELGALPWLLPAARAGPRPGRAVPWAWTASTPGRPHGEGEWRTLLPTIPSSSAGACVEPA